MSSNEPFAKHFSNSSIVKNIFVYSLREQLELAKLCESTYGNLVFAVVAINKYTQYCKRCSINVSPHINTNTCFPEGKEYCQTIWT